MPFVIPLQTAQGEFPEFQFVTALTPSEQKAAFHVRSKQGEDLCLKIIAPNYTINRLQREILALQKLSHPNVVKLREYTFSSSGGQQRHYMIEEFIAGTDLDARLCSGTPWGRPDVAAVFAPLCHGLAALRDCKVVHRDLKPTNIRLRPDGSPVIIDFGVARHLDLPALTRTSDGAAFGTPAYFAPEQADPASSKYAIDHRTDLFALGVMLYEALVGKHPFFVPGMTEQQLLSDICTSHSHLQTPGFLALPKQWQLLVSKLLEKERARRPLGADQVGTILAKIGGI